MFSAFAAGMPGGGESLGEGGDEEDRPRLPMLQR